MTWVAISTAQTPASSPDRVWVMYITRRLSIRSAITPPSGPNKNMGRNRTAVVSPSWVPLWVRPRTRKDWATVCIHVPATETSWPKKKSR